MSAVPVSLEFQLVKSFSVGSSFGFVGNYPKNEKLLTAVPKRLLK